MNLTHLLYKPLEVTTEDITKGVLAKRKVFGFINDRPPNTLIQPRTWILTTLKNKTKNLLCL